MIYLLHLVLHLEMTPLATQRNCSVMQPHNRRLNEGHGKMSFFCYITLCSVPKQKIMPSEPQMNFLQDLSGHPQI